MSRKQFLIPLIKDKTLISNQNIFPNSGPVIQQCIVCSQCWNTRSLEKNNVKVCAMHTKLSYENISQRNVGVLYLWNHNTVFGKIIGWLLTHQSPRLVLHGRCISGKLQAKKKTWRRYWNRLWIGKCGLIGSILLGKTYFLYRGLNCDKNVKMYFVVCSFSFSLQYL